MSPPDLRVRQSIDDHLLSPGTVQVWLAGLSDPIDESSSVWKMLSSTERDRANRLRTNHLRTRFVLSHAWLRGILSEYLEKAPVEIDIIEKASGKPELANVGSRSLHFNMSHSADFAVYAICSDREVGVDIEHCRTVTDEEAIATRFFTPSEADWIQERAAEGDSTAFFRIWTRKEAYVKGLGHGVSHGLNRFSVLSESDSPGRILVSESSTKSPWTVVDLDMPVDYVGAVAAEGSDWQVRTHMLTASDSKLQ